MASGAGNRCSSPLIAELTGTSREAARSALKATGGDANLAVELLLSRPNLEPPSGAEELVHLAAGSLSPEQARRVLQEAGGNMRAARERVLVECLKLGDVDLECTRGPVLKNVAPFDCPICQCPVEVGEGMRLRTCQHAFCNDCARMHVEEKVKEGQAGLVACPMPGCSAHFTHRELAALTDAGNVAALDRRALDLETARNDAMHHCPTADCGYIIHWAGPEDGPPRFQCPKCCKSACLSCKARPYHEGLTCQEYAQKNRDVADQQLSEAAITAMQGRQCKRCGIMVQKSSGCSKVQCLCGYRFCYECGSENAQCGCTPANHGFWDNKINKADFRGLRQRSSVT